LAVADFGARFYRDQFGLTGPVPDAMKPDFQGVRTHWNQGFMAFRKARRTRIVMLMIPVRLESGFADVWRLASTIS
jgi:hypothetical protein